VPEPVALPLAVVPDVVPLAVPLVVPLPVALVPDVPVLEPDPLPEPIIAFVSM